MTADLGLMEHVQSVRGGLKPAMQAVADAVLARPEALRNKNIRDFATSCGVSESSISRFVRAIGLPGYRAFQLHLAVATARQGNGARSASEEGHIYENIGREDTASSILGKVAYRTSDLARACLSTLDAGALQQAADLVRAAPVVCFLAAGASALAAENGVLRFARIGKPAIFHRDRNNQLLAADSIPADAVAIGISDSGRTQQTVAALVAAGRQGARTIALTAFADSPLARVADVVLITPAGYTPSGEELIYESMVSKFGQLIAIDVLYSTVAVHDFDASAEAVRRGNAIIRASRNARGPNDSA